MAYLYNLGQILELMGYEVDTDFLVHDKLDGNGPIIEEWNHADPIPTENDIETWYSGYLSHSDRLVEKKTLAKQEVDATAEQVRKKYISVGSGQAMSYLQKDAEAKAYKDAGYPVVGGNPINYPWIKAEMDATGNTGQECADDILTQSSLWITLGTTIETERRKGKLNIDASPNSDDVNLAKANAISNLESI